jgi:hypothetical protein
LNTEYRTNIPTLLTQLATVRNRLAFKRETLISQTARMTRLGEDKALLVKSVGLIDKTIEVISANGIGRIESIVTGGLQLVLDDRRVGLSIEKTEGKRGQSYSLVPYRGKTRGAALDTFGGSLSNVMAFLLRVIMIRRFGLAKYLFVDESFNGVSAEYQPMVSAMLHSLCQDHGFTIFAITHQPIMAAAANRVYRLIPGEDEDTPPTLQLLDASAMAELKVWSERSAEGF